MMSILFRRLSDETGLIVNAFPQLLPCFAIIGIIHHVFMVDSISMAWLITLLAVTQAGWLHIFSYGLESLYLFGMGIAMAVFLGIPSGRLFWLGQPELALLCLIPSGVYLLGSGIWLIFERS